MGDGISDMIQRGEAGDDEARDYLFHRIKRAAPWRIHKTSVSWLTHWALLRKMEKAGEITIDDSDEWLLISIQ